MTKNRMGGPKDSQFIGQDEEGLMRNDDHPDQQKLDQYLAEARENNTRIATAQAVKHYRKVYKGPIPCTAHDLALYLSHFGEKLKVATLEQRRSLIGQWHERNYGINPNNSRVVTETMRAIRKMHNEPQGKANALPLDTLERTVNFLSEKRNCTECEKDRQWRRYSRDRAMLLSAFWFGLRGSELVNIRLSHLKFNWQIDPPTLTLMVPTSKGDRNSVGRETTLEAMPKNCPIHAISDWLEDRFDGLDPSSESLKSQYVFSKVDRWGAVWSEGLRSNSINKILDRVFKEAGQNGVPISEHFSSHSMRRGIANWVMNNGASWSELMDWVGWKDVRSARKYVNSKKSLPTLLMARNQAQNQQASIGKPTEQNLEGGGSQND